MKLIIALISTILFATTSHAAILAYGPSGVATGAYTTIQTACNDAGVKKVVVTAPISLATNTTCPETVELHSEMGGVITTTGYTLTINAPFSAGLYQVFAGSGTVAGLKESRPEWFGAKRDGATGSPTDDGLAIKSAAAALASGGKFIFSAGTYRVYNTGVAYTSLGSWTGVNGIRMVSEGATIAIDPSRADATSYGTMFTFSNCSGISFDGPWNITGPTLDTASTTLKGIEFARFTQGCSNITALNVKAQGIIVPFIFSRLSTDPTTYSSHGIHIGTLSAKNCIYGYAGVFSGDDLTIDNLITDDTHRSYFVYGTKNHKVNIHSKDAKAWDVLLKSYLGLALENIDVTYTRDELTQASTDGNECVAVQWGDITPGTFKNIHLHLSIKYNATGQTGGSAVRFTKFVADSSYDASDRGHRVENFTIDGMIDGEQHAVEPVIFMDNLCTWGPGDYFTNIILKDLIIKNNTARTVVLYSGPFTNPLRIENVQSSTALSFAPNDGANTQIYPISWINSKWPNQYVTSGFAPTEIFAYAANTPIPAGYTGRTITNDTGGSVYTHTLPAATVGLQFPIINTGASAYRIDPNGSEIIRGGGAGKYLSIPVAGSATLKCLFAGFWEIINSAGTLTYEP